MNVRNTIFIGLMALGGTQTSCAQQNPYKTEDFRIKSTEVTHNADLGVTIWEIAVEGIAGNTVPEPFGQMDGAPVLGYVFPTSLKPMDVGFNQTDGILALALTSHPDFDDTPLWDENGDSLFDNDGVVWHPHWVILVKDERISGQLSVKQFMKTDKNITLPPTNPGMPMYMDSPGYPVITDANTIKVVLPDYRINYKTTFSYDAVTAFLKVNTSNKGKPMLGVYEVFSVASGDLSLPYSVK